MEGISALVEELITLVEEFITDRHSCGRDQQSCGCCGTPVDESWMCVSLLATGVASCRGESDASEIERPHLPHCYSLGGVLLPPTLLLQPREVTTKVLHSCYKGCYSLGKLLQSCHRVATELLQSCYTVLQHWDFCSTAPTVFATSCYKVATELLQTCYKVATKLLQPRQVATKLLQSVFVSVLDEVFLEQKMSSSIFFANIKVLNEMLLWRSGYLLSRRVWSCNALPWLL